MDRHKGPLANLSQFVHKRFLWLMIGSYAVASGFPAVGLWIRDVRVGEITAVRVKDDRQPLDVNAWLAAPERGLGGQAEPDPRDAPAAETRWPPAWRRT